MDVEYEVTVLCSGCGDKITHNEKVYCESCCFDHRGEVRDLEKKIKELENKIKELEKK